MEEGADAPSELAAGPVSANRVAPFSAAMEEGADAPSEAGANG